VRVCHGGGANHLPGAVTAKAAWFVSELGECAAVRERTEARG